jgi:hypothetical protein
VDWDTWSAAGTPGVDLLELYVMEKQPGRSPELERAVHAPWRDPEFRRLTDGYWRAVGAAPTPATLRTIGVAWWLSRLAALLSRADRRHLAERPEWVARNVDAVLTGLNEVHE